MQARTLDEVIAALDQIIVECRTRSSCHGYFACLYRRMTLGVREGIAKGMFADGPRMEKLDVVFANRYLDAYQRYTSGLAPTGSWKSAFDAASDTSLTVVQHLLLGMNAHINLDLGIAAAEISTAATLPALRADYDKINDIIAGMLGLVQDSLTRIAFPMYFIRRVRPETTEAVLNFSIAKARETAWHNAILLSEAGTQGIPRIIVLTDTIVNTVAGRIKAPGRWLQWLLRWIRWTEGKDVEKNIGFLYE